MLVPAGGRIGLRFLWRCRVCLRACSSTPGARCGVLCLGATSYTVRLWDGSEGRNVDGIACCRYNIPSGITQFNVRAVNDEGGGPWSGWVAVPEQPGAVSNVQFNSGGAVWSSVPGATSYTVRLWDGSEGRNVDGIACCRYNIPSGITQFNVRAVNGAGTGPWSGWVAVPEQPGAVSNVQFNSGGAVWSSVPGATSYTVRLWDGSEGRNVDGIACCRYNIPSGITQFNVRAVNGAGTGPWSGWVSIAERPGAVSNVQFNSGGAVWSFVPGATSYTVRLWDGSEGRNVDVIGCCRYNIPGGITFFNVRAVNGAGGGPWSGWERAADAPDPVRNLRFLAQGWDSSDSSDRSIVASWAPPRDDGGSNIIGYTVTISRPGKDFGPYRLSATKRNYTLSNPRSDTTYKVEVVARNSIGSSQADRRSLTTPERSSNVTTTTPSIKCPKGNKFVTTGGGWWGSTRIQALRDFKTIDNHQVKALDLGGIVSGEHNLEQSGCAWIHYHAVVKGNAKVEDNAVVGKPSIGEKSIGLEVSGSAKIYGRARVYGANTRVWDDAEVFGDAYVYRGAGVSDSAKVFGDAHVFAKADVYDNAMVWGDSSISDDADVFGNAKVYGEGKDDKTVTIWDNADVYGDAEVFGQATIANDADVYGNARVHGTAIVKGRTVKIYGLADVFGQADIYGRVKEVRIHGYAQVYGNVKIDYSDAKIVDDMVIFCHYEPKYDREYNKNFYADGLSPSGYNPRCLFDGEQEFQRAANELYLKLHSNVRSSFYNCDPYYANHDDEKRWINAGREARILLKKHYTGNRIMRAK